MCGCRLTWACPRPGCCCHGGLCASGGMGFPPIGCPLGPGRAPQVGRDKEPLGPLPSWARGWDRRPPYIEPEGGRPGAPPPEPHPRPGPAASGGRWQRRGCCWNMWCVGVLPPRACRESGGSLEPSHGAQPTGRSAAVHEAPEPAPASGARARAQPQRPSPGSLGSSPRGRVMRGRERGPRPGGRGRWDSEAAGQAESSVAGVAVASEGSVGFREPP